MKTMMILSALTITFVLMDAAQTEAQTAKRIQFVKGESSATVKGNTGSFGVTYVVRARSGQKMVLNLTPAANVGIKVETEGADGESVLLREERGGSYEIFLEEGGDFTIFLGSSNNKPVPFTLTVKITNLSDI